MERIFILEYLAFTSRFSIHSDDNLRYIIDRFFPYMKTIQNSSVLKKCFAMYTIQTLVNTRALGLLVSTSIKDLAKICLNLTVVFKGQLSRID